MRTISFKLSEEINSCLASFYEDMEDVTFCFYKGVPGRATVGLEGGTVELNFDGNIPWEERMIKTSTDLVGIAFKMGLIADGGYWRIDGRLLGKDNEEI